MTTTPAERWQPVRPLAVSERPAGVWWARVPGANDPTANKGRLCQEQGHAVYLGVRPEHATAPGCKGNEKARQFWVCAVCFPPRDERGK